MKSASAHLFAALLALERHGHSICASAEDHERKLLLNQADAAKRVDDVVKISMASADAGDVKGVALPLNYVKLSANEGSEQQLTVALRLPGVDRDQQVMIDTGSASLAFCDESLIDEAVDITKTDFAQCNAYSFPVSCPNDPSADSYESFYVGQIFQGDVLAYNHDTGKEIFSMDEVYFTIISKAKNFMCLGHLDGIIGMAFDANNGAIKIPSSDFNVSDSWHESCTSDDPYYKSWGTCIADDLNLPAPLEQTLKEDTASGAISSGAFGLYCDYAATIGSKVDTIVPSLGIFFGGDMALNNTLYNSGTPQVCFVTREYFFSFRLFYPDLFSNTSLR